MQESSSGFVTDLAQRPVGLAQAVGRSWGSHFHYAHDPFHMNIAFVRFPFFVAVKPLAVDDIPIRPGSQKI